jgi:zinc transporter ZupT
MALMPTLGFLAFYYFSGRFSKLVLGVANAAAAGVMLVASCGLLAESAHNGGTYLAVGVAVGAAIMSISQAHLHR